MLKSFLLAIAVGISIGCSDGGFNDRVRHLEPAERTQFLQEKFKMAEVFEMPNSSYEYVAKDTNGALHYFHYADQGTNFHHYTIFSK